MATKKNLVLNIEPEIDFELIGIAATTNDYNICIALDELFDLPFQLNFSFDKKVRGQTAKFRVFTMQCTVREATICLIRNKSDGIFLLPELRFLDFIIRLQGEWAIEKRDEIITALKKINDVNVVMKPIPDDLKDIEWLTFEFPDKDYLIHKEYELEKRKQHSDKDI